MEVLNYLILLLKKIFILLAMIIQVHIIVIWLQQETLIILFQLDIIKSMYILLKGFNLLPQLAIRTNIY